MFEAQAHLAKVNVYGAIGSKEKFAYYYGRKYEFRGYTCIYIWLENALIPSADRI